MTLAPVIQARWDGLAARERTLVRGALVLVGVAVLWWLCLAPALQTCARPAPSTAAWRASSSR